MASNNLLPEFKIPDRADLSTCTGPSIQAPRACYSHKDLVKITITEPKPYTMSKTYELPRGLLVWHSSYFAAALDPDSDFKKNEHGELALEECLTVFDAFDCWLYTGRLKDPPSDTTKATAEDMYLSPEDLTKIWVFGDMRGIPGLGNAAMDMFHERMAARWTTNTRILKLIYENSIAGSDLRKFCVDITTKTMSFVVFQERMTAERCPVELLLEALPVLVRRGENSETITRKGWAQLDRCQWHDHSGPGGKLRLEGRK